MTIAARQSRYFTDLAVGNLPSWLRNKLDGLDVIDWGCSGGHGTDRLSHWLPASKVSGIDVAEGYIDQARADYPHIEFSAGKLDGEHEVIFTSNTLEHFEDPLPMLQDLLGKAERFVIVLVPYQEEDRVPGHLFTFEREFFDREIDGWSPIFTKILPPDDTFWGKEQILAVFAKL